MENRIEILNGEDYQEDMYRIDLQMFGPDDEEDSGDGDEGSEEESEDEGSEEESEDEGSEEESEDEGSEEESEDEESEEESEDEGSEEESEDEGSEEESEDEGSEEESEDEGSEEESEDEESEEDSEDEELEGEDVDYELSDDVYESASDYDLEEEWLEEDNGDWTDEDYEEFGGKVFADNEHFGESYDDWMTEEGYEPIENTESEEYYQKLSSLSTETETSFTSVHFYKKGGKITPDGFLTPEAFALLVSLFGEEFEISKVHVVEPKRKEQPPKPQNLPSEFKDVEPKDIVDLRKYCSPVGDQKQTGRCKGFSMTHAFEMLRIMANKEHVELSANYTMVQTYKMTGTFTGYEMAHLADNGTPGNLEPNKNIVKTGICSAKLWPNDSNQPNASEEEMDADAAKYKLKLNPMDVTIDDLKKLLTKGIPVEFGMNTGEAFSTISRDGILRQAEAPSGKHGRHSMLIVGYIGNYYIVKNSWGSAWGDKGYCYITKKALMDSEPAFHAFVTS
ncbi:MAG: C1 family peptidase [Leptospiraceae bacterium]|nr:C1 family peptidase [Leptospiraceae bacterium]